MCVEKCFTNSYYGGNYFHLDVRSLLRSLKAWFRPNLHKIDPKVITLRELAEKLSDLAIMENLMTLTQF